MAANGYVLDGNRVDAAASRVVTSLRIGNAIGNGEWNMLRYTRQRNEVFLYVNRRACFS